MKQDLEDLIEVWPMGRAFDLPPDSVVVVAGAYKGKVIELMHELYHPARIIGFEPQPWAYRQALERVGRLPNVELNPFAIGLEVGAFPMGEWETDGCSFVHTGEGSRLQGNGLMANISDVMRDYIQHVDLAVFNMEGYEFDLLPALIDRGLIQRFDRLAVQFHHGFGNDSEWPQTREDMLLTHEVVIDNGPQWIYWKRRDA